MPKINTNAIADQIIAEAAKQGGETWKRIQKSAPLYFRGFAQALTDIALGVVKGEISTADAKIYTKNAQLMLVMSIANTSQIILYQVQSLIDTVLGILRTSINAALPVAIL